MNAKTTALFTPRGSRWTDRLFLLSLPAVASLFAAAAGGFAVTGEAAGTDVQWTSSIASRIEQEEYRVSETARGLQAPNRAQPEDRHASSEVEPACDARDRAMTGEIWP